MRRVTYLTLVAVGLGLHTPAAFADRMLEVELRNTPQAPVQLVEGRGRLRIHQAAPTSRAFRTRATAVKYANVKNTESRLFYWEGAAKFRNVTNRPVAAVQFEWEFFDDFHRPQGTVSVTDDEELGPRRQRSREWEQSVPREDLAAAAVRVTAVRFADGKIWNIETEAERQARTEEQKREGLGAAAQRGERERLRRLYEAQGTDALLEALYE